jgi:hypothetical protein
MVGLVWKGNLGKFDFQEERKELRKEYLKENEEN